MKWIKEIIKRGLPTIPVNILEIIPNSLGRLFIERWSGLATLGIYSHSLYYRRTFLMVFKAFSNSYSPEIVEAASCGDKQKMLKMRKIINDWTGFLGIIGTGVCLFSLEVIGFLTHGKFIQAAPIVSLWFVLIMVYFFGVPYLQYLLAKKKNRIVFLSEVIPGLLFCGLTVLFVKFFGMIGAAVSIILYFFSTRLIRRIYAVRLRCIVFERKSFWVLLAVFIGFGGILLITQPSAMGFTKYDILGIFSGVGAALAYTSVRELRNYYDTRAIVLSFTIVGTIGPIFLFILSEFMDYTYFLMDCGEGTQVQIRKSKIKLQKIRHIFISHLHGDHFLA